MSHNLISLKVDCPHCNHSLMDYTYFLNAKPSIKLLIRIGEEQGIINLCSSYGCYDKVSTIELKKGEMAKLSCTNCRHELPSSGICDVCGAPIVDFKLEKGGKVHVCSRIGCKNHYVTYDDIETTLSSFYNEFEYGSEDKDF